MTDPTKPTARERLQRIAKDMHEHSVGECVEPFLLGLEAAAEIARKVGGEEASAYDAAAAIRAFAKQLKEGKP